MGHIWHHLALPIQKQSQEFIRIYPNRPNLLLNVMAFVQVSHDSAVTSPEAGGSPGDGLVKPATTGASSPEGGGSPGDGLVKPATTGASSAEHVPVTAEQDANTLICACTLHHLGMNLRFPLISWVICPFFHPKNVDSLARTEFVALLRPPNAPRRWSQSRGTLGSRPHEATLPTIESGT